jgi:hypothetical protein
MINLIKYCVEENENEYFNDVMHKGLEYYVDTYDEKYIINIAHLVKKLIY